MAGAGTDVAAGSTGMEPSVGMVPVSAGAVIAEPSVVTACSVVSVVASSVEVFLSLQE